MAFINITPEDPGKIPYSSTDTRTNGIPIDHNLEQRWGQIILNPEQIVPLAVFTRIVRTIVTGATYGVSIGSCFAVAEWVDGGGNLRHNYGWSSQTTELTQSYQRHNGEIIDRIRTHAEQIAVALSLSNGANPTDIARVFVELKPCTMSTFNCDLFLRNVIPHGIVMYARDYPNPDAFTDQKKDAKKALKKGSDFLSGLEPNPKRAKRTEGGGTITFSTLIPSSNVKCLEIPHERLEKSIDTYIN